MLFSRTIWSTCIPVWKPLNLKQTGCGALPKGSGRQIKVFLIEPYKSAMKYQILEM